jgi:hypothetical protein
MKRIKRLTNRGWLPDIKTSTCPLCRKEVIVGMRGIRKWPEVPDAYGHKKCVDQVYFNGKQRRDRYE